MAFNPGLGLRSVTLGTTQNCTSDLGWTRKSYGLPQHNPAQHPSQPFELQRRDEFSFRVNDFLQEDLEHPRKNQTTVITSSFGLYTKKG